MVKDHSDSEGGNPLPPHRLLFSISSIFYMHHPRQDNTYRDLCYTTRGTLAGTRNSSMAPASVHECVHVRGHLIDSVCYVCMHITCEVNYVCQCACNGTHENISSTSKCARAHVCVVNEYRYIYV